MLTRAEISQPDGGICWIDLGTPDVDAAEAFYSNLFGWQIHPADATGYRLASLHGEFVAALGPAEDPGPPYWTVYAATRDARATARAAVAAGGAIVVPPTSAGPVGIAATIRDPAGAPLSLWQAGTHLGTLASGEPGTLAQVQLRTDHPAEHAEFLRAVLGWEMRDAAFNLDNRSVAFWDRQLAPVRPTGSPWLVHFHVNEVGEAMRRAIALGATAVDAESGILVDPTGAVLALKRSTARPGPDPS